MLASAVADHDGVRPPPGGGLILAGVVGLAVVGWVAARQIRSPAQVAADTAPPRAAADHRPGPAPVPLDPGHRPRDRPLRGAAAGRPGDVRRQGRRDEADEQRHRHPARPSRAAKLKKGDVVMTVDGRPVFALPGVVPMHRDLAPGDDGPDVGQLEQALAGEGFDPGPGRRPLRRRAPRRPSRRSTCARAGTRSGRPTRSSTRCARPRPRPPPRATRTSRPSTTIEQAQQTPAPADVAQARIDADHGPGRATTPPCSR